MLFELTPYLRVPIQILTWCWVLLLPGFFVTSWLLKDAREKHPVALVASLSLGLGLMAVPTLCHVWVFLADRPLSFVTLLVPASAINIWGAIRARRHGFIEVRRDSRLLWLGLAVVATVLFLTTAGHYAVGALDTWRVAGSAACFMEGTFRYIAVPSAVNASMIPGGPLELGVADEMITHGNVVLSSAHVVIFGAPGFRILRVLVGVLLGLLGWSIWERRVGRGRLAVAGLLLFALNPYVVMVDELDRNVMAFAFAALLYVMADQARARPWVLGLVAGFVAGTGLRMLPVVFLIPLAVHVWLRRERRFADLSLLFGGAAAVAWLWAAGFLPSIFSTYASDVPMGPAGDAFGSYQQVQPFFYSFLGLPIKTYYALGFPFHDPWVRAPDVPFALFLHWPMHLVLALGAPVVALSLLGLWRSWMRDRAHTLVLLAWGLPIYVGLSSITLLTGDLQAERLQIPALLPVLTFALVGLGFVVESRKGLVAGVAICVVVASAAYGLSFAEPPIDERFSDANFQAHWHGLDEAELDAEDDARLAEERRRPYQRVLLLPRYEGWMENEASGGKDMPPSYEARAASLTRWQDLWEPDLRGEPSIEVR